MESWSFVSGNKNFVSDESVSGCTNGRNSRSKNGLMGFTVMYSGEDGITRNLQDFGELGSSDSMVNASTGDVLSSKFGFGRVYNQDPAPPPNSASVEEEFSSKLSSSIVESNSRDSSLIDLKLGGFPDQKDHRTTANHPSSPQAESSMPVKKARAGQRPFCQVHGCRKDLSSSKEYHKKHKVCEIHSKTAQVIVNGIQQRFCQQCSRFHLLAAFDDGKRSCRKRLAGHNERRRKPHIGIHVSRAGKFFQSYTGTRFEGNSFASSSFICQDTFPSRLHTPKYETSDWYSNVKVEDRAGFTPEIAVPNSKGQTHSKSKMSLFSSENQNSPFPDDGLVAMTRNKTSEKNNAFLHNMATSDFDIHPLFHSTTIGSEDLTILGSSSAVQGPPAISSSGCALSLLSSQSQNSPNQSVPTAVPLISPCSHSHYSMTQDTEKLTRVCPQSSTIGVSNTFNPSRISSTQESHMEPILISDNVDSVNYGISRVVNGSGHMKAKNYLFGEDGSTIDLLQLSSQLQRVEHERESMQVKEENDNFFGLRIT